MWIDMVKGAWKFIIKKSTYVCKISLGEEQSDLYREDLQWALCVLLGHRGLHILEGVRDESVLFQPLRENSVFCISGQQCCVWTIKRQIHSPLCFTTQLERAKLGFFQVNSQCDVKASLLPSITVALHLLANFFFFFYIDEQVFDSIIKA